MPALIDAIASVDAVIPDAKVEVGATPSAPAADGPDDEPEAE